MSSKIVVILGPTASGKTELAVKLAKKFNGEIVCADSRQIYVDMRIGTASPMSQNQKSKSKNQNCISKCKNHKKILKGTPHHLFNIISPKKRFSVAQYQKLAIKTIKNIQKQGKIPFLVGGTGLYVKAVVDNLQIPKVKPNKILRCKLEKQTEKELFKNLKKLDPKTAIVIDSKNKRRLVRALEVCLAGKKFSQKDKGTPSFDILQIGIKVSKDELAKRIEKRTEKMFKMGLEKEVDDLVKKYGWTSILKNTIGYAEWKELNSFQTKGRSLTPSEAKKWLKALISLRTRQFAKRQLTWFKKDNRINWVKNYSKAQKIVKQFLK